MCEDVVPNKPMRAGHHKRCLTLTVNKQFNSIKKKYKSLVPGYKR